MTAALQKAEKALSKGDHAAALALCDKALVKEPSAAAYVLAAACSLRDQPPAKVIGHLRKAAALAPVTEIRERLSSHLAHAVLDDEMAFAVGAFFNAGLPRIGPPLARRMVRTGRYINVLGTSHVRFLSSHGLFFPLFVGMGPDLHMLTEDGFAACRRKLLDNLDRVDPAMDALIVLDAEAYYHVYNNFGTRPENLARVTEADLALMATVTARYEALLGEIKTRVRGRLMLMNAVPSYIPVITQLAAHLNELWRPMCQRLGVGFLDFWSDLYDPASAGLRRDLAAEAYNDDIHLSEKAIPVLIDGLRRLGVISADVDPEGRFGYAYLHGFPVSAGGETRIWPEADIIPANAFKSEKVAAAHVAKKALDMVAARLAAMDQPRVLMINVKEGFLPLNTPVALMGQCVAVCDTPAHLEMANRIANFAGRDDIKFTAARPDLIELIKGRRFDVVLVNCHPDDLDGDLARAEALLDAVTCGTLTAITTDEATTKPLFSAHAAEIKSVPIGNRHIPERWRESRLLIQARGET